MNYLNDDLRINEIKELLPPVALLEKFPASKNAAETVSRPAQRFTIFCKRMMTVYWW